MYPRFVPQKVLDEAEAAQFQKLEAGGSFFAAIGHRVQIYILRHGQSEGNARNTYQGRLDYPLSERGRLQAQAAGNWLFDHHPDVVIASPMARARQTAEIVAETAGYARLEFSDFLVEIDTGIFSGMEAQDAARTYPDIQESFRVHSWDAVPGAESSASLYARAMRSWMEIRDLASAGASCIVCVTHGGLLQWMIKSTVGAHAWLPLFPMSNCGISLYEVEPNGAGRPAFVQWAALNLHPPSMPPGPKPVF